MSSFSRIGALLGGAALVSAVVYYTHFRKGASSSSDEELLPALTEEEVTKIMADVLMQLKALAARMARAADNIKQQLQQQGQDLDNARIMKSFILPHFETNFAEMQAQVFAEHDVEEEEVEEAHFYYCKQGCKQLLEINETVQEIYKQFGGEVEGDGDSAAASTEGGAGASSSGSILGQPKDMALETVLEILYTLKERMVEATELYCDDYIDSNGGPPSNPMAFQGFQDGLVKISEQAEVDILEQYGYSQRDFQFGVLKYQESPEINQSIMMMQTENHKVLQSKGMNFGMGM